MAILESTRATPVEGMDIVSRYISDDVPFVRISAPMVRFSKLPFRLLVRNHGVDLAYSPMIMGDSFCHSEKARAVDFTPCAKDRPLIAQFASKSGPQLAECAELIVDDCDGVDLNCGCPQRWAMQDGYGSALLRQPELIADLVKCVRSAVPRWRYPTPTKNIQLPTDSDDDSSYLKRSKESVVDENHDKIPFSVSIKIRLVPTANRATGDDSSVQNNIEATVELVRRAAMMGIDWVSIHGRTPNMRTSDPARWDDIREIVENRIPHLEHFNDPLPIFLNGDVKNSTDAWKAHQQTGCQGVMVARGLLTSPAMFDTDFCQNVQNESAAMGTKVTPSIGRLYREWLQLTDEHSSTLPVDSIRKQAYWLIEKYLPKVDRRAVQDARSVESLQNILRQHWSDLCD